MPVLRLGRHHGGEFVYPRLREGLDAIEAGALLAARIDRSDATHADIGPCRCLVLVRDAGCKERTLQLGRERSGTRGNECAPCAQVDLNARTGNIPVCK